LALGLAACGATSPSEPSPSAPIPTEAPTEAPAEPTTESTPEPTPEPVVVFTDEVLEQLVREAMGKPEGDITVAEAEAVEGFNFRVAEPASPSPRIKDITALKYFKNLKSLDLSYHLVEDFAPLAGMKNLIALYYFDARSVKDFSALSELTGMLDLIISSDTFTNADMQRLSGMTDIEMLWIQGGKELTDISVVANFKKLKRLNIEFSGVTDLSPAAGLTTLEEVSLRGSDVSDVSPLKGLVNLKNLYLEDCPVTDYSPLADIYPNLENKDFEM
jgi:hypothetical protein